MPRATSRSAVSLRIDQGRRTLIDLAARAEGKDRTAFMLDAACERAKDVLAAQTLFVLDAKRYRQFLSALDKPVDLTRLRRRKAPWE